MAAENIPKMVGMVYAIAAFLILTYLTIKTNSTKKSGIFYSYSTPV